MARIPSDSNSVVRTKIPKAVIQTQVASDAKVGARVVDDFASGAPSKIRNLLGPPAGAFAANASRHLTDIGGTDLHQGIERVDPQAKPAGEAQVGGFPTLGLEGLRQHLRKENTGYAHSDTARFPELPSNRDAGGSTGASAEGLRPSTDPRDWLSGSRGKDFTGVKTVEDLGSEGTRSTYNHGDGTATIVTETRNVRGVPLADGRHVMGMTMRTVEQRNPDGSAIINTYVRDLDGQWLHSGGGVRAPGESINRTLDPNAEGGGGASVPPPNYQIRDSGLRDPNRYRLGNDPGLGQAPSLVIDRDTLVGDPELREHEVDLDRAPKFDRSKIPVHVLPPRPDHGGGEEP